MNNTTMTEIENIFQLLDDLKSEARKADSSNRIVNEYLAANPDAAKTLLDRAKAWSNKTANRTRAESKIRSCDAEVARIQAAINADRDMIAAWTKQINEAKVEILRLQKAFKKADEAASAARAELAALA